MTDAGDIKIRRCAPPDHRADPGGGAADRNIRAYVRETKDPTRLNPDLKIRVDAGRVAVA